MDKGKVKLILICLAGLVVLFLLYKILSKTADSKLEASNKINQAKADIEVEKALEEYAEEQTQKKLYGEAGKNVLLSEIAKADGIETIGDYRSTLSTADKNTYDRLYSKYVNVMGISPNLMSLNDLLLWEEKYDTWAVYYQRYIAVGGNDPTVNFLNTASDTPEEMEQIWMQREGQYFDELGKAWDYEYTDYVNGSEQRKAISLDLCKKWLAVPTDLQGFKSVLEDLAQSWAVRSTQIRKGDWETLYVFYDKEKYVDKSSAGNIKRWNDMPEGTLNSIMTYRPNDIAYLNYLLIAQGGILIPTEVKGSELKGKSKIYMKSWGDIVNGIGSLRAQDHGESTKAYDKWIPARMREFKNKMATYSYTNFTEFGLTRDQLVNRFIEYAIGIYNLSDNEIEQISSGERTISEIINGELYN